MVTDWPEAMPGLHASAVQFAETIGAATGGRIKIEVFPAGALVRPFETFDAVGAGVADMYSTNEGYFVTKSPAFQFFAAMPFGFTANELFAWVQYGGGRELWDALSGQFNIKSLLCSSMRVVRWAGGLPARSPRRRGSRAPLPDGRTRRRGAPAARRHRGDLTGQRNHTGAPIRRYRRQRMDGPGSDMAIGLHKAAELLLLSRLSRTGQPAMRSGSTSGCGRASMPATNG